MKKALVLGCGLIGSAMARDLAADAGYRVSVADVNPHHLSSLPDLPNLTRIHIDLSHAETVQRLVPDFDVVLGALPSRLGFSALRAVIAGGKPYADISFMSEDPLQLDPMARERGVTAIVDCGVAPGLANMIIGRCASELDELHRAEYYVGGLPKVRRWPYQYKAPFAPYDVLEEYLRPARMIENGHLVVKPALSEPELLEFPGIGTLEAFNTDGLRSLLQTVKAENMKEKTLRYPGHRELMEILRASGFLGKETLDADGLHVRPLDLTAKLLFPLWKLEAGESEFTILQVRAEGSKNGLQRRYSYYLHDEYDSATGMTSMARTTGFPCAILARMLAEGSIYKPGVLPPEAIGMEAGMLERVTGLLGARGVILKREVDESGGTSTGGVARLKVS